MTRSLQQTVPIFAYGSNMSVQRMRDRIPNATVLETGYVRGRRFEFHKRSIDGSAKANAMPTGRDLDRVWGVIYQLSCEERDILDRHEFLGIGYDRTAADVFVAGKAVSAYLYEARSEAIDGSLRPYHWYHRFVLQGAIEHGLPEPYIAYLNRFETMADPDPTRDRRNRELIGPVRGEHQES